MRNHGMHHLAGGIVPEPYMPVIMGRHRKSQGWMTYHLVDLLVGAGAGIKTEHRFASFNIKDDAVGAIVRRDDSVVFIAYKVHARRYAIFFGCEGIQQ